MLSDYGNFITFIFLLIIMSKRFTFTFILSLTATVVFAQEGDPTESEERVESEIIIENEIDSASKVDLPISNQIKKNASSDFFLGVKPKTSSYHRILIRI